MQKYNARSFIALHLKNAAYNAILVPLECQTSSLAQKRVFKAF